MAITDFFMDFCGYDKVKIYVAKGKESYRGYACS
jgi:hypothetical protein